MKTDLFEKASVPKAYFTFALPVVLSMVVSLVYNMVDTYFISLTGETNLIAGVALCAPVFTLMLALGDIFGLGGSSLISRLLGRKDAENARKVSAFCYCVSILCGVAVTAVMLLFAEPILRLLGADSHTFSYARDYYTGLVWGAPAIIFSLVPSNLLRTEGLAKESMAGNMIGTVVNIILDPLFIFGLHMGAAGAAVATVIGNVCADVFFVWVTYKKSHQLSFSPKLCHVTKKQMRQIMVIGIPASITNLMQSVGVMLMNRYLLPYGSDCIAAMGIVLKITMIAILILVGFSFGAQPLFGYHYGAGNTRRLWKILRFAYGFEGALALGLTVVLALLAPQLTSLFLKDQALVGMATEMLQWQVSSMVFVAIGLVTTCLFQSMGKALGAFLLSISRQGVLFALAVAVGSAVGGYTGVIVAQPAADVLTALLAVAFVVTVIASERKKLVLGE